MNRRHALGGLLGLAVTPGRWGGPAAIASEPAADGDMVAHRPDIRRIVSHRSSFSSVAISPDGRRLVTAGRGDKVRVWDAQSGRELLAFGDIKERVGALALSRDGCWVATIGTDGWVERGEGFNFRREPAGFALRVWDASDGREVATVEFGTPLGALAFAADGATLTTLDHENRVQVWEVGGGREVATIKGTYPEGNRSVGVNRHVAFDAQARRVALSTYDIALVGGVRAEPEAALKLWNVDASDFRDIVPRTQLKFGSAGRSCLVSPDGSLVVMSYYNLAGPGLSTVGLQKVAILNFATGAIVRHTERDLEHYESLIAFSPDGKWFLSARQEGVLRLWDVATGRVAWTIKGPEGVELPRQEGRPVDARAVAFLPKGLRVASGGLRGSIYNAEPLQVWDAELDWPS